MFHSILTRTRNALKRFAERTEGSLSVETAIILPALCWVYVGSFVWFDAFRMQNVNLKATYTIADMISREYVGIDQTYFDGLENVYDYLTYGDHATQIRVSIIECTDECESDDARVLEVCWSKSTTGRETLDNTTLQSFSESIPLFHEGDALIMTETFMSYNPAFNVGLGHQVFKNAIFTRPRLSGQVKFLSADGDLDCYNND